MNLIIGIPDKFDISGVFPAYVTIIDFMSHSFFQNTRNVTSRMRLFLGCLIVVALSLAIQPRNCLAQSAPVSDPPPSLEDHPNEPEMEESLENMRGYWQRRSHGALPIDNAPVTDLTVFKQAGPSQDGQTEFLYGFTARAFYANDQRIEWTGQEETFGVEGVFSGCAKRQIGSWDCAVWSEIYLNQPFDRNLLSDHPDRISFRSNFEIDTFEISQLFLTARQGDWLFAFGKMVTPFGRAYSPQYTNSREDGPFLRTESILWRETGAVAQYDPGIYVFTVGLLNGGDERDANSSKALIARIGIDSGNVVVGASIKAQDGIGSEHQKTFNNHVGLDAMYQSGIFRLSGEVIYDQYGFRKPGFDLQDIFWRRSLYYRQQNRGVDDPITGVGYYVNLDVFLQRWTLSLNYGEYFPESIGDPRHDVTSRRGLIKVIRHTNRNTDFYLIGLVENELPVPAQAGTARIPWSIIGGFEFRL